MLKSCEIPGSAQNSANKTSNDFIDDSIDTDIELSKVETDTEISKMEINNESDNIKNSIIENYRNALQIKNTNSMDNFSAILYSIKD